MFKTFCPIHFLLLYKYFSSWPNHCHMIAYSKKLLLSDLQILSEHKYQNLIHFIIFFFWLEMGVRVNQKKEKVFLLFHGIKIIEQMSELFFMAYQHFLVYLKSKQIVWGCLQHPVFPNSPHSHLSPDRAQHCLTLVIEWKIVSLIWFHCSLDEKKMERWNTNFHLRWKMEW